MQVNPITDSQNEKSFKSMQIYSNKAQQLVLRKVNDKQYEELRAIINKHKDNIVFCFIYSSKNGKRLEARMMCQRFLKNFKEYYKQIPVFESYFGFIKRMSKQMDRYNKRLQNAGAEDIK